MGDTKKAFIKYVDAATDLAESIKRNIVKNGIIDDETVLKLNEFIIASNRVKDVTDEVNESDPKLN